MCNEGRLLQKSHHNYSGSIHVLLLSGPLSNILCSCGLSFNSSGMIQRDTRLLTSKKNCLSSLVHTTDHGVPGETRNK